jgi:hypothetical protein
LAGLVALFRGEDSENQNPQSQPAVLAEPTGKGSRVQRREKDNTDSVRLEIERLQKEEEAKRLQQEKAPGKPVRQRSRKSRKNLSWMKRKIFSRRFGRCGRPSNPFSLHPNEIHGQLIFLSYF